MADDPPYEETKSSSGEDMDSDEYEMEYCHLDMDGKPKKTSEGMAKQISAPAKLSCREITKRLDKHGGRIGKAMFPEPGFPAFLVWQRPRFRPDTCREAYQQLCPEYAVDDLTPATAHFLAIWEKSCGLPPDKTLMEKADEHISDEKGCAREFYRTGKKDREATYAPFLVESADDALQMLEAIRELYRSGTDSGAFVDTVDLGYHLGLSEEKQTRRASQAKKRNGKSGGRASKASKKSNKKVAASLVDSDEDMLSNLPNLHDMNDETPLRETTPKDSTPTEQPSPSPVLAAEPLTGADADEALNLLPGRDEVHKTVMAGIHGQGKPDPPSGAKPASRPAGQPPLGFGRKPPPPSTPHPSKKSATVSVEKPHEGGKQFVDANGEDQESTV